jgi:hypothetical protein
MPFIALFAAYMSQWYGTVTTRNRRPHTPHATNPGTRLNRSSLRAAEPLAVAGAMEAAADPIALSLCSGKTTDRPIQLRWCFLGQGPGTVPTRCNK